MANIQISFRNFIDESSTTLTGSGWLPEAPLSNIRSRRLSTTARSSGPTAFIDIDLGQFPEMANVFAIIRPSWTSLGDMWRLTAGTSKGDDSLFDSGWQLGYPRAYTLYDRPFESENWWFGTLASWELESYVRDVFYPLRQAVTARWWRLEVQMDVAPNIEIGRLWLGQAWHPGINMDRDTLVYEDLTEVQESLGGVTFFDVRPKRRVYRFSLPMLREMDEGYGAALDIQRRSGISGDIIVIPDADDAVRGHKRSFYGRLRQLDPLERLGARFRLASTSFVVEELL